MSAILQFARNEAEIDELRRLALELEALRADMLDAADDLAGSIGRVPESNHGSALNLAHYLGLRRHDRRALQLRLAELGLSSLGRSESHVLGAVDRVLQTIGATPPRLRTHGAHVAGAPASLWESIDLATGSKLLQDRASALLGPPPEDQRTRVMVTMPSEAARDFALVRDLLESGMNCMRINCAHDDPSAWHGMIEHLRRAEQVTGRRCKVLMDLAGPKIRTGPLAPGPQVAKLKPERDPWGRVTAPARVWLYDVDAPSDPPSAATGCIGLARDGLETLRAGAMLCFEDARGSSRHLRIVDASDVGAWALLERTAYFVPGTLLEAFASVGVDAPRRTIRVAEVPPRPSTIRLRAGDTLVLTPDLSPGRDAVRDPQGRVLTPARIGCTCAEIFRDVRSGEDIHFDDGRIAGVVVDADPTRLVVRIERAPLAGGKLRPDQGINLPTTELRLPALTAKDASDLEFASARADLIALSFVNDPADVVELLQRLDAANGRGPGIIVKIETQRAPKSPMRRWVHARNA